MCVCVREYSVCVCARVHGSIACVCVCVREYSVCVCVRVHGSIACVSVVCVCV